MSAGNRRKHALKALPWAWFSLVLALPLTMLLFKNRAELARHLIQFALVWLPLLLLFSAPRLIGRWKQVLLLLGGSLLALGGLHLMGPSLVDRFAMPFLNMDVDHRPKPSPGRYNADGVTPDRPNTAYRREDFVVVVLGDSFAGGYFLKDPFTSFPFQLQDLLDERFPHGDVKVANFGYVSSSPVLQYRQLVELGARYKPDLVLLAFDMTDFHDDLSYSRELAKDGVNTKLDLSIFTVSRFWFSWMLGLPDLNQWLKQQLVWSRQAPTRDPLLELGRFFAMQQSLEKSEPFLETSWQTIKRIADYTKGTLDAEFVLFVLPRYQQYDPSECPKDLEGPQYLPEEGPFLLEPFRFFEQRSTGAGFPVHSLLEDFRDSPVRPTTFVDDPHWNTNGHKIAAQAILRYLEKDGLLDLEAR